MTIQKVVFTENSKIVLDGPDGWWKGWVLPDREALAVIKRRQQGRVHFAKHLGHGAKYLFIL